VAFALPGSAIITILLASISGMLFAGESGAYFSQGDALQWFNAAITNFRGIYFEVERDTLIAIPLFIFMGLMLQRSKVAEDLLITMAQLFGPVPGGLGIAVVFVGALLAATTGIVGATVIAMGLISLPVMMRAKYDAPLATGTIAASGTLGQIIPPSIVLIILADQLSSATDRAATIRKAEFKDATGSFSLPTEFDLTSTSAGEMFLGALIPGLILVGLYMVYILFVALVKKDSAPPVPFEGKYDLSFFKRVFLVLVPPLVLIFTVLGSIILGIATVNQAGAIGAVGAERRRKARLYTVTFDPPLAGDPGLDGDPFRYKCEKH
jgi:tripartite ATP-independent transporter DctM subunit